MANGDNEVKMMMSVVPGAMTGFAALNAGMSSILNVFNSFTRSFDAQFGLMDAAITTTSFVVTQLGVDAMHAFGEFEQGMKIVQMVSGQTAQDMEFLKQKANDFSVQYRMDIDQITEGLQTLGRAGLNSASEQTEVLQAGLNTAKLEGRDLNAILQELIQNTSLLGGNLKSNDFGESSQYVNDLLVATSMTAPITTHDVSETLKYSGGIAAAAGANIETEQGKAILEDYMGAIAAFAQKGVTGSIAGTALRAFLNKPATQDSSVTEALASIKLKPEYLWEDGEETMKPISEQIGLIQKQMDKLDVSKMDRLQIWSKIVGGKMGQQMMKLDSESIKEVTKDIQAADSASSLAAGSMKTFEANVKQVSEQGQVLQRSVGEKLVFFANPILEIINKVTEFLGQDGMSWPLTAGVLTAVSILARRIVQVFNVAKTELGSLLSMGREALAIHVGKHGYAKWEEGDTTEEKTSMKMPVYPSKSSEIKATTLKNFDKEYSKIKSATDKLSVSAMKAAGVSDQNIALAGRMSTLTKQIPIAGTTMTEGALWGTAIKHNLLTSEEMAALQRGYSGGMSGRPLGDLLGKGYITTVVPRIEALSLALNELGIQASKDSAIIRAYNATFGPTSKGPFGGENLNWGKSWQEQMNTQAKQLSQNTATAFQNTFGSLKTQVGNWQAVMTQQAAAFTKSGDSAKASINDQNKSAEATKTAGAEIAVETTATTTTVIEEFQAMSAAVSAAVSGMGPKVSSAYSMLNWNKLMGGNVVGPFTSVDPTRPFAAMPGYFNPMGANFAAGQQFLMNYYFPPGLDQLREELGIPKNPPVNPFAKGGMFYDETRGIYVSNYGDLNKDMSKIPPTHVGPTNHLMSPIIQGQYTLDEKGRIITNPYPLGATNVPLPNTTPRMPGYAGNLPSEAEIRASNINNEAKQAEIKASQQNAAAKQEEIAKIDQEIAAKQAEIDSAYADAEAAARDAEAFAANAAAVDRMTAAASTFAAFLEGRFTGAPVTKGSGNGIWSIGLSDKQKQDLKDVHAASDERERARKSRAEMDKTSAGMSRIGVSQTEAQRFRDEAKQQVASAKAAREFRPTSSLISNAIGKFGNSVPGLEKAANNYKIATENASVINRVLANPNVTGARGLVGDPNYNPYSWQYRTGQAWSSFTGSALFHPIAAIESSGFYQNFSNRLNRDRTGSFFSFGKEERFDAAGKSLGFGSATKGLKGIGNKLLNATDMIGGPFMIAIMAATTAIQLWQKKFQEYCQELQDARKQLQEAYSERSSAEDQLEQTFRENNPDAEPEEIEMMVLDTYGQLYDDRKNHPEEWMKQTSQYLKDSAKYKEYEYDQEKDDGSYKEKEKEEDTYEEALRKNTAALYSATAEIDIAMSKLTSKMNDTMWGIDGWTGKITDALGYAQDHFWNPEGTTYTEAGDFLLTATQQDENYQGSKEMAGLLLEDFHDAKGNWKQGLKTLYGEDADFLTNVMNMYGRNFLKGNDNFGVQGMAHFANRLTPGGRNRIQASMMNDKKTWQSLAKEIFKYESKNKKRVGTQETSNKRMERLIQKLQIDTHLSRMQVIQAAYFQELQDMYQVMEQVFTPLLADQAQTLAQNLLGTQNIDESSSSTKSSTYGTQSIASVISANVALIARSKAAEAVYNEALSLGPDNKGPDAENKNHLYQLAKDSQDANDFYKKAMDESYGQGVFSSAGKILGAEFAGAFGGAAHGKAIGQQIDNALGIHVGQNEYAGKEIATVYRALAQISINPDLPLDKAIELSRDVVSKDHRGIHDIMTDIGKMYSNPKIVDQIEAAYGASDIGEPEGSGGGSGGGSGSGDNDKDQGTRKERVDLVLCNKKEIPKLNVNLFKKPPTFTVLNKNFKLRDVKINTEDKPKAIMASIKNAFIDVQKRSDPKIIQDEEAEYDPVAATDGNALPSGSSRPKTNNNS